MTEKVTGYLLVAAGIIVIIFSAFSVYSVFTGKAQAVELFKFDGVSISARALLSPEMAAQIPSDQKLPDIEILPADMVNSTTNILAHMFLMGFIASIGYKVAMLGVNLLKPVVVKVSENKIERAINGSKEVDQK